MDGDLRVKGRRADRILQMPVPTERTLGRNERKIMTTPTKTQLRSQDWFGKMDKMGFVYRSWMKNQGLPHHLFDGRPVIGICNTWSELTPCNAHFRELAEYVKKGVYEAACYRGQRIGSGTGVFQMSEAMRAGKIGMAEFIEAESCMNRSRGHCMTMGTASTMASIVESLGMGLPHNAAIPAVDARRQVLAHLAGRRIVEMVREDLTIEKILTREAFENAIRANAAIGGSTNAVNHLIALAGRIGVDLKLADFELGSDVPFLLNLQPSGEFLMEDFYYAGGLPVILRELGDAGALHKDALTVNGKTIWENVENAECYNRQVIHSFSSPFKPLSGIVVLRGNLAPQGAVIKPSAATPALLTHRGRAVVFENIEQLHETIDDENLEIDETCVMVLKGAGPKGYPGFAEVGNMPLPPKLLRKGITDMVRVSDGRMSGTAFGTVVLHVAPEAAAGGPLALVRTGDMIELNVPERRLHLEVSEEELARRKAEWVPPEAPPRGWYRLFFDHVLQADEGVDFDFLVGKSGAEIPRHSH